MRSARVAGADVHMARQMLGTGLEVYVSKPGGDSVLGDGREMSRGCGSCEGSGLRAEGAYEGGLLCKGNMVMASH